MSLTSFLQVPAIKARFKQDWQIPTPRPQRDNWVLVAPPISPRPQLIGTAFDYVLRFHLCRINTLFKDREYWIAEGAVGRLESSLRKLGQDTCETARTRYQLFLDGAPLDDNLLGSSLQLAQLDFVLRSGKQPPSGNLDIFDEDIADLRQLIAVCDWSDWSASQRCLLNPSFGIASSIVGGADADIHLDNTLYEFKTVRRAEILQDHYNQLIGYAVLNFLNNGPTIDELSIYFSRFTQTVRWPAPRLNNPEYESFILWFCESAHDVFGTGLFLPELASGSGLQPKLKALAAELHAKRVEHNRIEKSMI